MVTELLYWYNIINAPKRVSWPGVQQYLSVVLFDDAGPEVENQVDHEESVGDDVEDDPRGSVLLSKESDAHWQDD